MKLYSLKEIRQVLEREGIHIPDGTLRNYRDAFDNLLIKEGSGRFTRYHKESIEIFKEIRRLRLVEHLDDSQIRERITAMYGTAAPDTGITREETVQAPAAPEVGALAEMIQNIDIRTKIIQDSLVKLVSLVQQQMIDGGSRDAALAGELKSTLASLKNTVQSMRQPGGMSGGGMMGPTLTTKPINAAGDSERGDNALKI